MSKTKCQRRNVKNNMSKCQVLIANRKPKIKCLFIITKTRKKSVRKKRKNPTISESNIKLNVETELWREFQDADQNRLTIKRG